MTFGPGKCHVPSGAKTLDWMRRVCIKIEYTSAIDMTDELHIWKGNRCVAMALNKWQCVCANTYIILGNMSKRVLVLSWALNHTWTQKLWTKRHPSWRPRNRENEWTVYTSKLVQYFIKDMWARSNLMSGAYHMTLKNLNKRRSIGVCLMYHSAMVD